jgi:hypothetical protein
LGSGSFNDGAGMARHITAANFIHFNMPHGTDYLNPQLTVEQAWDIAAYMISQPRAKSGLDRIIPTCWRSRSTPLPLCRRLQRGAAQIRPVRRSALRWRGSVEKRGPPAPRW